MYEFLCGRIVEKKPSHVILDVNGTGYHVLISLETFSALPEIDVISQVLVHLIVREDVLQLYGFARKEERNVFRLLIGVSGIGPRLALTILSGIGTEKLKEAIATANVITLTNVSGIGKKTAQRLIIELREKIVHSDKGIKSLTGDFDCALEQDVMDDTLSALIALGYKRQESIKAIQTAHTQNPKMKIEELVREALNFVK